MRKIKIEFLEINLWRGLAGTFFVLFIITVISLVNVPQQTNTDQLPQAQIPGNPLSSIVPEVFVAAVDNDPCRGDHDAPVLIIEFIDFQCPHCATFHATTFPKIVEQLIDTGMVTYCVRDYPLNVVSGSNNIHALADDAAILANCAHQQGKYWEMQDLLLKNQEVWVQEEQMLDVFNQFIDHLELDKEKLISCISDETTSRELREDVFDGLALGIEGTPAFFMNGVIKSGTVPFSEIKDLVLKEYAH